ncbi:FAD-dependent oxidoreductase [Mumia zhuanghuii]|uniref:FAD-dependent oxidoreductase n=2 Tax=Mumia TaxID=1546255 RepID=A0ABW1QPC9_9ACTN|nr:MULTISPECIES: FAD-dependent oxidoreductase [Mumia]KAA1425163.1 FAD-dependent oxidoreductase [Mumia zhuanghuii]
MSDPARDSLPTIVIGAGPVGLAAAAHLLERGLDPLVLEAGEQVGAAVASWGHVRIFSPWRYNIDAAARRLLEPAGWSVPDLDALPTGGELVDDYLTPLADTPQLSGRIHTRTRVLGVSRLTADKTRTIGREGKGYRVRVVGPDGAVEDLLARAVIDASGTYGTSNPLGVGGLPALGEADARAYVTGPLPDVEGKDRVRFAGRRTLVVGMGHSAANTLLSLIQLAEDEPGTEVVWAIRGGSARRLYGGGADDELPARGLLGTRLKAAVDAGRVRLLTFVEIDRLDAGEDDVRVVGRSRDGVLDVTVDAIVNATGFRPDLDVIREVRLDLDPALECPAGIAEMIDPNFHSCGTVPPHGEKLLAQPDDGFYIVGMKSYGRAPTFLMATGYEQVRSIAAALAGDRTAADTVELNLPETGVCSSDLALDADGQQAGAACCGSTPAEPALLTLTSAPAGVGFATGVEHGRSGDAGGGCS